MNHDLLCSEGVGTSGRGGRDEVHVVGSVAERHVQPDLGPCVCSLGKSVGRRTDTAGLGTCATRAIVALRSELRRGACGV